MLLDKVNIFGSMLGGSDINTLVREFCFNNDKYILEKDNIFFILNPSKISKAVNPPGSDGISWCCGYFNNSQYSNIELLAKAFKKCNTISEAREIFQERFFSDYKPKTSDVDFIVDLCSVMLPGFDFDWKTYYRFFDKKNPESLMDVLVSRFENPRTGVTREILINMFQYCVSKKIDLKDLTSFIGYTILTNMKGGSMENNRSKFSNNILADCWNSCVK